MPLFKSWEINNAIGVLRKLLARHYSDLTINHSPEAILYDNSDKTLMLEAVSSKPLAKEFILRFNMEDKSCDIQVKRNPDDKETYLLLIEKETLELLILRANRFACYLLNHELRYHSKKGMQPWRVWGERNEANDTVPHLRSYQLPKPAHSETEAETKSRKEQILYSIDKMWHKMTGSVRGNAMSIDSYALDTFKIGGTLSLVFFPGQGGGCLIYEDYSISQIAHAPRTAYMDLSSDDEHPEVKKYYRLPHSTFKYVLPPLNLDLSDSDDTESLPRVKRRSAASPTR